MTRNVRDLRLRVISFDAPLRANAPTNCAMDDEVKRAADTFWNATHIPDDVWGAWLMRESARLMRDHLKHVNDQISSGRASGPVLTAQVPPNSPNPPNPPQTPRWSDEAEE